MRRSKLLEAWPLTHAASAAWRTYLSDAVDDADVIRAVGRTLARRVHKPEAAIRELVSLGEIEAASLLLANDEFVSAAGGTKLRQLESEVERARVVARNEVSARVVELQERARRVGRTLHVDALLSRSGRRRSDDELSLAALEQEVRKAEDTRVHDIRRRLDDLSTGDHSSIESLRVVVEQAIAFGDTETAEAALVRGPSLDVATSLRVPPPPVWPYRREPLARVASWFFGEGALPPGFDRFRPAAADPAAAAFLGATRGSPSEQGDALLAGLAAVLATDVLQVDGSENGRTGYFADLSAPGLHAFGRSRWPNGVPIWLPHDPAAPNPYVRPGELLIRLVSEADVEQRDRVLHLSIHDVLAVLHDTRRRERLLALLGRQVPLDCAFGERLADVSVRWARSDVPSLDELRRAEHRAVVLVGAPGMGKSTLLAELAREHGGVLVKASRDDELHTGVVSFVDGVDDLDDKEIRRLARDIHWVTSKGDPSSVVLVAVRPVTRSRLMDAGDSMFGEFVLSPRSIGALREQAATMLGWLGVAASNPGSYDRMALLAGGNPTVLFMLVRALVSVLSATGNGRRKFDPEHVERAWRSESFRSDVRALLWDSIAGVEGVRAIVRALVDFAPISRDELLWVIAEAAGRELEPAWLERPLDILVLHGLVDLGSQEITPAVGGLGLLLPMWVEDE